MKIPKLFARAAIISVACICLCAPAKPETANSPDRSQRNPSAQSTKNIEGGKNNAVRPPVAKSEVEPNGHNQNLNHDRHEISWPTLNAWQAIFSFALVGIGILQYLIYRSMRHDAVLTNRAFVFIERIGVDVFTDHLGNTQSIDCFPVWVNSGNTQTKRMVMSHFSTVLRNDQDKKILTVNNSDGVKENFLLGPKGTCIGPSVNFHIVDVANAFKAKQRGHHGCRLFIFGFVAYADLYSTKQRRTEFCVEVIPLNDPVNTRSGLKFILRAHGKHNCADEECSKEENWFSPESDNAPQDTLLLL